MIDYSQYPAHTITPVMRPEPYRVKMAVPEALRTRFYRTEAEHKRAAGPEAQGSWFLRGSDPRWEQLMTWESWLSLQKPVQRQVTIRRTQDLIEEWEAAVRATEWGRDPLWAYGSRVYDGAGETLDPRTGRAWFPRARLMIKYGTTDLATYAGRQGLPYPTERRPE